MLCVNCLSVQHNKNKVEWYYNCCDDAIRSLFSFSRWLDFVLSNSILFTTALHLNFRFHLLVFSLSLTLKHVPLHIFRIFSYYLSTSLVILVVIVLGFMFLQLWMLFEHFVWRIQALEKTRNKKQQEKNKFCTNNGKYQMHIHFFNISPRMVFISAMLTWFEYFQFLQLNFSFDKMQSYSNGMMNNFFFIHLLSW